MPINPTKTPVTKSVTLKTGNEDIMAELVDSMENARSIFARKNSRNFDDLVGSNDKVCKV